MFNTFKDRAGQTATTRSVLLNIETARIKTTQQNKKAMEKITEDSVKKKFKELKGKRKENKIKLIEEISILYHSLNKQNGVLTFSRNTINFLVSGLNISQRQQRRYVKDILSFMLNKKLISEDVRYIPIYSYRNKPLVSFDYGSYSLMMSRNGYKKHIYEEGFNAEEKRFFKIHKGFFNVGEKIQTEEEYNTIETRSKKPKNNQAVYDNGNKSVVRELCFYSPSVIYTIL